MNLINKTVITAILIGVSIASTANAWAGKTVCIGTNAQDRNGLIYLPNTSEPFSGKNLCKYENGQTRWQGKIDDGHKDGTWTYWHENGQMAYERNYKDGKKDGKWTRWDEDGWVQYEGNYKDGKCIDCY